MADSAGVRPQLRRSRTEPLGQIMLEGQTTVDELLRVAFVEG